jgi:hypothetical protein
MTALSTDYGLDAFSAVLHESALEKGFWDGEITYDKIGNKLALVHSEVTEVLVHIFCIVKLPHSTFLSE